jgi:acetoin utilization deacetylase AcuC-like enzyme
VLVAAAPELVLYNAGVDVHCDDALGLLSLTDAGVAERDRLVMAAAAGAGIPLAAAIGGGYAPDHAAIVQRHMHVHRAAAERVPQFAAAADARRAAARTAAAATV